MKKYRNYLLFSSLMLLLGIWEILLVFFFELGERQYRLIGIIGLIILFFWVCGIFLLFATKSKQSEGISRLFVAGNVFSLCLLLVFGCFYLLADNHPYTGKFSIETDLFDCRNVMVIVPHQDDDINLVGGLIEQYAQGNSEVSVVFTTNGDSAGDAEERAAEVASVLTQLGIKKENIYYLGFGDLWEPQVFDEHTIAHIYNSVDPDAIWTSRYGATATYGTRIIPCYLELPYTRNNYLHSLESIIQKKMPDTIFAVDFDRHIEHKATDLFFEEALCNILKNHPDYQPTVYKGFCYGTAWEAIYDFHDSLNPLSTKKTDESTWNVSSFGYNWEDRVRFPMSSTNLNIILQNNSVYRSFNDYESQFAYIRSKAVLNGDKVFWRRRTDSLLYNAEISVGEEVVSLLNDFKLKDFTNIAASPDTASGVAFLNSKTVQVNMDEAVTASCIYLYDNPSETANLLEGYIVFNDGSKIEFGELSKDGSATVISFPEKEILGFEIVPTKSEGDYAGLSEIELYHDTFEPQEDTYLMAVDPDDNFVYDYLIHKGDTASFRLYRFPYAEQVNKDDISVHFQSDGKSNFYNWDNSTLTVNCEVGTSCTITISEGNTRTTFTITNPTALNRAYLTTLHHMGNVAVSIRYFVFTLHLLFSEL